jgi:hypothetical protein
LSRRRRPPQRWNMATSIALTIGPEPLLPDQEPDPEAVETLAVLWLEHRDELLGAHPDAWGTVFDEGHLEAAAAAWPRLQKVN